MERVSNVPFSLKLAAISRFLHSNPIAPSMFNYLPCYLQYFKNSTQAVHNFFSQLKLSNNVWKLKKVPFPILLVFAYKCTLFLFALYTWPRYVRGSTLLLVQHWGTSIMKVLQKKENDTNKKNSVYHGTHRGAGAISNTHRKQKGNATICALMRGSPKWLEATVGDWVLVHKLKTLTSMEGMVTESQRSQNIFPTRSGSHGATYVGRW